MAWVGQISRDITGKIFTLDAPIRFCQLASLLLLTTYRVGAEISAEESLFFDLTAARALRVHFSITIAFFLPSLFCSAPIPTLFLEHILTAATIAPVRYRRVCFLER